jgi:hypothetical protein
MKRRGLRVLLVEPTRLEDGTHRSVCNCGFVAKSDCVKT